MILENNSELGSLELSDAEYIKELEGITCFLAGCYEKAKETYVDRHLNTCSASNPGRRELSDSELDELSRFPMIQGSRLQAMVKNIASANKPVPTNIESVFNRFVG